MPNGRAAAFGLLRRASAGFPLASRAHVLGRLLSCPFFPVLDEIPPGASVLDVGAGHGVFARLAAERGARRVVALEPDIRKFGAVLRHPVIAWVAGYDPCLRGTFDAVVLCDVLDRVPLDERDALLARLFARLEPGGRLVLKDMSPDRRVKLFWNEIQEAVATGLLHLTIGSDPAYEPRDAVAARLARAGFTGFRARRIDAGYPHPHVLYTARRPA